MAKELKNAEEFQQLIQENHLVVVLFYRSGPFGTDPLPGAFSGISEQFKNVAFGQANVDKYPELFAESQGGPAVRPPCLLAYRDGTLTADSGELDPISGPGRITGFLHHVVAEE